MTPKGGFVAVIAGVLFATVVSFIVASIILKTGKETEEDDLLKATEKTSALKGKESRAADFMQQSIAEEAVQEVSFANVESIIFACDAGMGSSAMGASILRNKVKKLILMLRFRIWLSVTYRPMRK